MPKPPSLAAALKGKTIPPPKKKRDGPLWKGPTEDGITFSMLCKFLVCRERFRLHVIEGLQPIHRFSHRIEYGQMWHICEEAFANNESWTAPLTEYARQLLEKYPMDREQVDKWYNVCLVQFPEYVQFWSKHPDVVNRTPLYQEQVFSSPYTLPSGREVLLRGKWDAVDIIGKGSKEAVYLQENKTKGDVDQQLIQKQLTFELQTMLYLVALQGESLPSGVPLAGVRYNVVRRPLSGGKGTIKQKEATKNHRAETMEEYYARLGQYIKDEPETYFFRWNSEVSPADIARFRERCLDPILEQLCWWYDSVTGVPPSSTNEWEPLVHSLHFIMPFGVYSPLLDGGETELDIYLRTGSEAGLHRVDSLFTELV